MGDKVRAGDVHLALERQPDVLGDLAAPAVRPQHVLGADVVGVPGGAVPDGHGDAGIVLLQRHVLGVEPDPAAARGRLRDQDRLQQRLRDVAVGRRARGQVVRGPVRRGLPGAHAADLVADEAGAEHRLAHPVVLGALREHLGLDAEVAEDIHGALVGDVAARRVGRPAVLGDHHVVHAERGERRAAPLPAGPLPMTRTSVSNAALTAAPCRGPGRCRSRSTPTAR